MLIGAWIVTFKILQGFQTPNVIYDRAYMVEHSSILELSQRKQIQSKQRESRALHNNHHVTHTHTHIYIYYILSAKYLYNYNIL